MSPCCDKCETGSKPCCCKIIGVVIILAALAAAGHWIFRWF